MPLQFIAVWLVTRLGRLPLLRRIRALDPERGDVPGWVMVTIMTAGLVVVIFVAFRDRIVNAINDAIDEVVGGTKGP